MIKKFTLPYLVENIGKALKGKQVLPDNIWQAVRGAVNGNLLISNLAETLRISGAETEKLLIELGFGDMVAQSKIASEEFQGANAPKLGYCISGQDIASPFPDIFSIEFSPPLTKHISLPKPFYENILLLQQAISQSAKSDPFPGLYRKKVSRYYKKFMESDAKALDQYIKKNFGGNSLRYVVNSGIGANEQFNHFPAHINNNDPDRKVKWLIIDSPRHLMKMPEDASCENTLFMEFSRSGKTEETVKIHEYTPRKAKRIVFANCGPLRELGRRDANLLLDLPDEIPGRFGRNKTPILLAPMYVAGMDTKYFWDTIDACIRKWDIFSASSIPMAIAKFIYIYQKLNKINQIYLGCNDDLLALCADEFIQFWNEGINKNGNDISMTRYSGLLRDSHVNIEALLSNCKKKMGLFFLRDKMASEKMHPMISQTIDPINEDHMGLFYGDEEKILAKANYQRFCSLMPSMKIKVKGDISIEHGAVLGQLWADITFCYSRLVHVDPGSNPEVKHVRDRAAELLAKPDSFVKNPISELS